MGNWNYVFIDDDENEEVDDMNGISEAPLAAHELPTAWRSIRIPESGEVYYFNKITGETTWNDPFENSKPLLDPRIKLLPDWEPVLDKESGDTYYWNTKTQETTWEIPLLKTAPKKKKQTFDAKDLLHVPVVNRFLDLKRNTQRMEELAI